MTGPPTGSPANVGWWDGTAARWRRRLVWYQATEVVVATLIVVVWGGVLGFRAGWIGLVLLLGLPLWIHFAAVETGNHPLLWLSTVVVLSLAVIALSTLTPGSTSAISVAAAALTSLFYNELVRLNHARRRGGAIDDDVYLGSARAMGVVAVVTTVGIALADGLADGERTWLWLPVALAVVLAIVVMLLLAPGRRAPAPSRQRWRPGERIPPPPLGRDDELPRL